MYKKLTAFIYSFVSVQSFSEGYRISRITSSLSVDENVFMEIVRIIFIIVEGEGYSLEGVENILESSKLSDFIDETIKKKNKFNLRYRPRETDAIYIVVIFALFSTALTQDYYSAYQFKTISLLFIFALIRFFKVCNALKYKEFEVFSQNNQTQTYVSYIKSANNEEERRRLLIDFYLTVDNYFKEVK